MFPTQIKPFPSPPVSLHKAPCRLRLHILCSLLLDGVQEPGLARLQKWTVVRKSRYCLDLGRDGPSVMSCSRGDTSASRTPARARFPSPE